MNKSSSAEIAVAAARTKNTSFPTIQIDEVVYREKWTDSEGHSHSKTTIKPSKKGAAAGAAAGALVAGPVGAVVGGAIGLIFGPEDKDKNSK